MKIKKNKIKIVIFINFLLISTVCSPFIQIEAFQNNDTIASNSKPDIIDPSLEEITLVKKFDVKENVLRSSESLSLGGGPASIIDTDGRVRITPTTVYPFSAICKIRAWWGIFDGIVGTGAIVYKNHVLTAAHVVYDESKRTIKNKQLFKDLDNMEKKVNLALNTKALDLTEIKEIGIDFEKE